MATTIRQVCAQAGFGIALALAQPASAAEAACPAATPADLAAGFAAAQASASLSVDGQSQPSALLEPYDAEAAARRRSDERAAFEALLSARARGSVPVVEAAPDANARASIEQASPDAGRLKVGTAVPIARRVDLRGVDLPAEGEVAGGMLSRGGGGVAWEIELHLPGATAVRVHFDDVVLADGAELHVYNEHGRVAGPYRGAYGEGGFWAASVFGDRVRVQLRARDAAALSASRFTIGEAMYLGPRFHVADAMRAEYETGPAPSDIAFCGVQVPDCTIDGMCALQANPGLSNATKAVAHLEFVDGGSSYICTGTLLNTALVGSGPRQPYLLTANHCISTAASAASLEAYFHYHTASCNGACNWNLVQVDGATLLATGALPTYADFTLLRLSPLPAGSGLVLLGWNSGEVVEGGYLLRLSHPAGAPLAYSLRRRRIDNAALPHCAGAAEPTFLYSGLATQSSDSAGGATGGSSGSAAIVLTDDASDVYVVGQLLGHCPDSGDSCDPNTDATVDGAFHASFPYLRRFLVDRIFAGGFEP